MKRTTLLYSLALVSVLVATGITIAPSLAEESSAAQVSERQWLSIPQIHEKLVAAGYRNIEKIEREHGSYEARATDSNGQRIKLHVNPQNGEISDQRSSRKHAWGDDDKRQRDSADCNKRRCRDDQPQHKINVTPANQ
ncbi:MAG: PepSY domain-containing protein [Azonexus sp.]|nr:PepSY domain-containing protein [Azonexus sp.]